MKPIPDDLLRDTLDDAAPDSFSELALTSMLTHLQRRKTLRRRLRMASAGCALTALAVLALALMTTHQPHVVETLAASVKPAMAKPPVVITEAPVRPAAATSQQPPAREITDEELLALFPGQAVGFIGTGDHREFFLASRGPPENKVR